MDRRTSGRGEGTWIFGIKIKKILMCNNFNVVLIFVVLFILVLVTARIFVAVTFFMTIMYPLQAQKDYTELKYSLRSIEKFFKPPYEVVVVGDHIPDWLTGVIQITVPDIPGRKQLTIKKKIIAALRFWPEIFFMNDDIFLLRPSSGSIPNYWHGNIKSYGESGARPLHEQLQNMKKQTRFFDVHIPIIYDRRFIKVFEHFFSDVIVKSCYVNFLDLPGTPTNDYKVNRKSKPEEITRMLGDRICFSTGPSGLPYAIPVLEKLFPDKSQFEL